MQLQSKQQQKEKNQDVPILTLTKDVLNHRATPRKMLTAKEKMVKLSACIDRIMSMKDVKVKKNHEVKNNGSSKHNHEIKQKSNNSEAAPATVEKGEPKKRGRKKKIIS
jgi:hypothetical protein